MIMDSVCEGVNQYAFGCMLIDGTVCGSVCKYQHQQHHFAVVMMMLIEPITMPTFGHSLAPLYTASIIEPIRQSTQSKLYGHCLCPFCWYYDDNLLW